MVAGILLYSGFNFLRGIDFFSSTNRYILIYDKVDGLTVSNPVMLNGLAVGRVEDIEIIQDTAIKLSVTVSVDNDIKLGDSTVAMLVSSDLFGEKAIELVVGNNSSFYQDGDTIRSQIPKGLLEMVQDKAMPVVNNVDSLLMQLRKALDEKSVLHIQTVLANFDTTSVLLKLMLDQNRKNLLTITGNMSKLTASLNTTAEELKPILLNMQNLTDSLKKAPLAKTVADMDSAVLKLNRTLAGLEAGEGSLGKLLKDDSLYTHMDIAVKHLDSLFIDVQKRPKRYVHFSVFGGGKKDKK